MMTKIVKTSRGRQKDRVRARDLLCYWTVVELGMPMIPHLLCYQGLAVDDDGFALDALNLGHPRLSLI
ncbi:hypothetical protein C6A37_02945 [Desulfobacteraceae bacterium SEEP-SAG9]|nr:hypothetical protein C6A37_02945 [Desulfobacteraceae bacterium SEEP-SAG9]